METRQCKYCGKTKSLTSFDKVGRSKKDGSPYYRAKCHQCRQPVKNARKQKIKQAVLDYKKKRKCCKCGFDDFRALEFHHPGDDKDHNIADMIKNAFALEKVMAEINKCEVVCANCHRIIHY